MSARTLLAAFVAPVASQDLFLAAGPSDTPIIISDSFVEQKSPQPDCPPLKWVKEDFGSGHWILNYTDKSWEPYMTFLGLPEAAWYNEFHASDVHQYAMFENTFIMNHTIPLVNFSLLFEASLSGTWDKNPYPAPTPAGLDPSKVKVNLTTFRNVFEKPGVPHPDSCWALRTDMPMVQVDKKTGKPREYLNTFWRELTSPIDMRCTLHIKDSETGELVEPWASQMKDTKPFPDYSYRYFRKTVESFGDALKRLPHAPTGLRPDTYFN